MNDEWGTPLDLFDKLDRQFNFQVDIAASDDNHLVNVYMTKEENALEQSWDFGGWVWCNPPYSRGLINQFVDKAVDECLDKNIHIVMLTMLDPSTKWFRKLNHFGTVVFLPDKLKFRGAKSSYPFPCCITILDNEEPIVPIPYYEEPYYP